MREGDDSQARRVAQCQGLSTVFCFIVELRALLSIYICISLSFSLALCSLCTKPRSLSLNCCFTCEINSASSLGTRALSLSRSSPILCYTVLVSQYLLTKLCHGVYTPLMTAYTRPLLPRKECEEGISL